MSAALRLPLIDAPPPRAECIDGPRPCRRVTCRHHLLIEAELVATGRSPEWLRGFRVHPAARGAASLEDALHALPATCALDVASQNPDGMTFDEIGGVLGITRERSRQIVATALAKMREAVGP